MAALVEQELFNQKKNYAQSQLVEELDEAKRKSLIDPLTRLWNREGIENIIIKQVELCGAQDREFGLALVDIDNFKQINDTYGHCAGDYILRSVSKMLLDSLREIDSIGRWGGEEFLMIIDVDDIKLVQDIVERARINVKNSVFLYEEHKILTTFTAGLIYVSKIKQQDIKALISRVDKQLYLGKRSGKNKVFFLE